MISSKTTTYTFCISLIFIFFLSLFKMSWATVSSVPKGSGIPMYGLDKDLQCNSSKTSCTSTTWLTGTISKYDNSANLVYLYPNYPYINFFAFTKPTSSNWKAMVDQNCEGTTNYIGYNVESRDLNTFQNSCAATGPAANAAYNTAGDYQVLPTFSFDTTVIKKANECYNKNAPYGWQGGCSIPCPTSAIGGQQIPAGCSNGSLTINSQTQLKGYVNNTGALIGLLIASDSTAQGVSFDIEGPPFVPDLADSFYNGLISTLQPAINKKYIGVWRGVNIFGRDSVDNIGATTLNTLAANNGFIILSMYDIGPTKGGYSITDPDITYQYGGGLDVGEPALWYAGDPVKQIVDANLYKAVSGYSTFELMLFGSPTAPGDCHAKDMIPYVPGSTRVTLFNGCPGSISFMQRMKNLNVKINFQVGLPAVASTTEWITTTAWATQDVLDGLLANANGSTPSDATKQWLKAGSCGAPIKSIQGKECLVFSYKSQAQQTNDQASYFSNGNSGALPILEKNLASSYMGDYFMGLYIYGLKAPDFDHDNCVYQLLGKVPPKDVCFGNYTDNHSFQNNITETTWTAITNFHNKIDSKQK